MGRSFYIATMGCQMNESDSDHVSQLLLKNEMCGTDDPEKADFILINTCSVRAKAEQKAFSLFGRIAGIKKRKPNLVLGIMGCIAQQEGNRLLKRFPQLDMVIGTREINNIPEILQRIERYGEKICSVDLNIIPTQINSQNGYSKDRVKSFITIMVGCDNFCSYCIVPHVRGREISFSPNQILEKAEALITHGVKEITLLGQNVNSYFCEEGGVNFPILLKKLSQLKGLKRIRFTTSHPKDLSDELIKCFGELDNLCPHIHLPFQAGSNRILKLMNRKYTREHYFELIKKIRKEKPDIAITSDVMVGFPGETQEDFEMTLDLIRKIGFDNLFSFKYSDRKGTTSEKMGEKIDEAEKSLRLNILQDLQKNITIKKNSMLERTELEVLIDGRGKKTGQFSGRTKTNKIVNFNCDNNKIGQIVKVAIKSSSANSLFGKVVDMQ